MEGVILPPVQEQLGFTSRTLESIAQEARYKQDFLPSVSFPLRLGPTAVSGGWSVPYAASSGGWVEAWYTLFDELFHTSIYSPIPIVTDATGSADVRLRLTNNLGMDVMTSSQHAGNNFAGGLYFNWLHGQLLWEEAAYRMSIEVNVAAGNVNVFMAWGAAVMQRMPSRATISGIQT